MREERRSSHETKIWRREMFKSWNKDWRNTKRVQWRRDCPSVIRISYYSSQHNLCSTSGVDVMSEVEVTTGSGLSQSGRMSWTEAVETETQSWWQVKATFIADRRFSPGSESLRYCQVVDMSHCESVWSSFILGGGARTVATLSSRSAETVWSRVQYCGTFSQIDLSSCLPDCTLQTNQDCSAAHTTQTQVAPRIYP